MSADDVRTPLNYPPDQIESVMTPDLPLAVADVAPTEDGSG
jgi:hypothetical protein